MGIEGIEPTTLRLQDAHLPWEQLGVQGLELRVQGLELWVQSLAHGHFNVQLLGIEEIEPTTLRLQDAHSPWEQLGVQGLELGVQCLAHGHFDMQLMWIEEIEPTTLRLQDAHSPH